MALTAKAALAADQAGQDVDQAAKLTPMDRRPVRAASAAALTAQEAHPAGNAAPAALTAQAAHPAGNAAPVDRMPPAADPAVTNPAPSPPNRSASSVRGSIRAK